MVSLHKSLTAFMIKEQKFGKVEHVHWAGIFMDVPGLNPGSGQNPVLHSLFG